MRITKNLLLKFTKETVNQRKRSEPDLHAAYLMGSLLDEDPLLGGTTDIDLVLVHKYLAPAKREVAALTPEVSLDIYHKVQNEYDQLRELRQDAWMGYPLTNNHILLFDTDHWLEYAQSCVTADFHSTDNVMARVTSFQTAARDGWRNLFEITPNNHLAWLDQYLDTLSMGANAIAGLIGPPLTTRRFMITLKQRLETLGVPEVWAGFYGLLGCAKIQDVPVADWVDAFEGDLIELAESSTPPEHLSAPRLAYYVQGIRVLANGADPTLTVWPMLRTWLDVHLALPEASSKSESWGSFLAALELTGETSEIKTEALDAYLDSLEVLIESWAHTYGV
jgi:hypothetical protein